MSAYLPSLLALVAVLSFVSLLFMGRGYMAWVSGGSFGLLSWYISGIQSPNTFLITVVILAVATALFGCPSIRRPLISRPLMSKISKLLPAMGETEKIAMEAGTVWWEGELFSGDPDWSKLLNFKAQRLTPEEQAFLDGPVEDLCTMLDDWQIANDRDLSPEVWTFIKSQGFLGIIIPKEYGGLGFSALMHSEVVARIASRSVTAAVTVMVPNSLGPGELLMHYGTQEQKDHYLPQLATGVEVPCFALTEPSAGSDAANGQSKGIICKDMWNGEEILGIRITFDKRYITLAPIATVIGLAFRLYDPDNLIGDTEDIGITCALLPRETPGMIIGQRHDPMGVPFQNGPIHGENVFVPMDYVIGGQDQVGNGWRMLMETLAAGRGISLPSLSVGAAQLACRATSAYGQVREQFGLPIAKFEGVAAPMASIAGHAYFMDAVRTLGASAVDQGERPSVASAIAKAYLTEGMRLCLNDAMDIHAGAAIIRGPKNIFSRPYISIPIGITVEGANILTRSLIVFGQGAMRCHPFAHAEITALANGDTKAFDRALFGHINHVFRNGMRSFITGLTGGLFLDAPLGTERDGRYYRRLARLSAVFAFVADIGMMTLGGALKRKEHLSGRYADAFAWLFLSSCTLKRFYDEGSPNAHRPLLNWVMTKALYEIETALVGVLANLPNRFIANLAELIAFPLGTKHAPLTDRHINEVADTLIDPILDVREVLSNTVFIPRSDEPGLGELEFTLAEIAAAHPARTKLDQARRDGKLQKDTTVNMAKAAHEAGILDQEEVKRVLDAETARNAVIQVDSFDAETFKTLK
ncbi:MAG: acyl-CoA dehydrogenase [Magnetovibrio sp.]|nr:acyl-CoA dehydrogenase [Magnetovibrio sp.]